MAGQNAEGPAQVLGAQRADIARVDQERCGRRDRQMQTFAHAGASAGVRSA